jgi:uncharacterized membrane protein YvbJ
VAKKDKNRKCSKCGEKYSKQRLRCPQCGEANDLIPDDPPREGLLDRIPGIQDLSDGHRMIVGLAVTLISILVGVVVYFILTGL